MTVAADGKGAYVSVSFSPSPGVISEFSIDPVTGALSLTASIATGVGPGDIAVTPLPRVPTSKAQCQGGGWRSFPQFKNQADCVNFVETAK